MLFYAALGVFEATRERGLGGGVDRPGGLQVLRFRGGSGIEKKERRSKFSGLFAGGKARGEIDEEVAQKEFVLIDLFLDDREKSLCSSIFSWTTAL